jgi:hypothetical protein
MNGLIAALPIITAVISAIRITVALVALALMQPITWAIIAIGLLAWAIIANWDSIAEVATNVFTWIGEAASNVWTWLGDLIGKIGEAITTAFTQVDIFVGNVFANIGNGFIDVMNKVSKGIADLTNGLINIPIIARIQMDQGFMAMQASAYGLAEGGTVLPRAGGTLARIGEAGRPESVVDTANLHRLFDVALNGNPDERVGATVNVTVNNPQAEPTSKTVRETGQMIGSVLSIA